MQSAAAVISSKGQVTLPAAMRAKLGITPGSHIHFELREEDPRRLLVPTILQRREAG